MKQEDKELLLKDLCARLPYGVKTYTNVPHLGGCGEIIERTLDSITIDKNSSICLSLFPDEIPYLRPMSSMTEEEKTVFQNFIYPACNDPVSMIDWLNQHHFDYRGLIEKGLAIEVTDENNPYK